MTLDPLPWRAKIAPTLCYAYFSAEAAKKYGSFIYLAHDGSEVAVTCVGNNLIDRCIYDLPPPPARWELIPATNQLSQKRPYGSTK